MYNYLSDRHIYLDFVRTNRKRHIHQNKSCSTYFKNTRQVSIKIQNEE